MQRAQRERGPGSRRHGLLRYQKLASAGAFFTHNLAASISRPDGVFAATRAHYRARRARCAFVDADAPGRRESVQLRACHRQFIEAFDYRCGSPVGVTHIDTQFGAQAAIAFVATQNPERARVFYECTIGLTVESEDGFAIVCNAHGTQLRIQKVASFKPQPFTVFGWRVVSLDVAIDWLVERGVSFERYEGLGQDERGVWTAPSGARIAWLKDPDGNVLSLSQT